jgi:hypothetical protein
VKGFSARVLTGPHLFVRDQVTVAIRDDRLGEYLMRDGSWQVLPEGESSEDIGILIPAGAIEALAVAVAEYQGHTSHADTEARVLREWLAVERARVEKALDR